MSREEKVVSGSEDYRSPDLGMAGEEKVLLLTDESSRAFIAALEDPPTPNENLRRLAQKSELARPPEDSEVSGLRR